MSRHLPELLSGVAVADPSQSGGLQVFGLRHNFPSPLTYRTLDDAIADASLEVTEVSEGGSVPTLRLVNKSDTWLFLMAGEQLIGAKQNRVLNTSLMVAGHADVPIPVSCVEQGRWSHRSHAFGSHGTASHGKLRKVLTESVTTSYHADATPRSDQGKVWGEVSRKLGSVRSSSDTMALEQAYTDTKPLLDRFDAELPSAPEGCNGVVFALHGQVVALDLFDQPSTLVKLWPKLVRAFALDAIEPPTEAVPPAVTKAAVAEWLAKLTTVTPDQFKSPGLGDDMRLKTAEMVGAGLVVEESMVHLQAFPSTF